MRLLALPAILSVLLVVINVEFEGPQIVEALPTAITPIKPVEMLESGVSMGLQFEHRRRSHGLNAITDMYGNGVCVFDFDDDGYEDIFVVAGQGTTRRYGRDHWWNGQPTSLLYHNVQGRYFSPVDLQPEQAIVGFGCTVGDLDHDGREDLLVGDIGKLHLLLNNGKGFSHQIELLNPYDWPTALMIDDLNQDGLNDIVVATLVEYHNDLKVGDQEYGYQARTTIATSDYTGQNNLVLQAMAGENLQYQRHTLTGQQRTLSLLKAGTGQVLAVNAKGSNSVVQGLKQEANSLDWLTFAAVQVSPMTVANKPHYLITNHGNRGIQLLDLDTKLNQAWARELSNDQIDAAQSWATLIHDFNNDGFDDVFLAAGYDTPALNTPSRPQGNSNFILLQDLDGQFQQQQAFTPNLSRSSRGAAYGDFNNDGFTDLVVVNNNSFVSLYLNQGNDHHWLSVNCRPQALCQGSQWQLGANTKTYESHQPYLSKVSNRVHFGLGANSEAVDLVVKFAGGSLSFNHLAVDQRYDLDLTSGQLNKVEVIAVSEHSLTAEQIFHQVLNSKQPQVVLAQAKPEQAPQLLELLRLYQQGLGKQLSAKDSRFTLTIAWLLTHIEKPTVALVDVLIASENRVFVDHLVAMLPQLDDDGFCHLSQHLGYWFEEEEVLPETKLTLLADLLQQGLNASSTQKRLICAIDAGSFSEETTLGASLLPLLDLKRPLVAGTAIRALGRLKYAQAIKPLGDFCANLNGDDLILVAECQVSLKKLQGQIKVASQSESQHPTQRFFALHSQQLLFDLGQQPLNLAVIDKYTRSSITDHRHLAYLAKLMQKQPEMLLEQADLPIFAQKVKSHYPQLVDRLVAMVGTKNPAMAAKMLPYMSSKGLSSMVTTVTANELAKALVDQCVLRQSLRRHCQSAFADESGLAALSLDKLKRLEAAKLYYLIATANKVKRRVIARQFYSEPLANFDILHYRQLYQQLNEVSQAWLEAFLNYSFVNQLEIETRWLKKVTKNSLSQRSGWTPLYLTHSDEAN